MNKEVLLNSKYEKQKEIEEIDKQLEQIYDEEFRTSENYIGKFYNLNNSNIYFHVTGYNSNRGELFGTEICFSFESLDIYHKEYKMIDKEKYTEVTKEKMKVIIKNQIDYLVEDFMR